MKVLILSITAGQGHHQCAKAITENLEKKGVACTTLDAYEYINPLLSESVAKGYLMATQYSRAAYSKFYRWAELKEKPSAKLSLTRITHSLLSKKLVSYINNYNPDVIICTHIFAAQMITEMKKVTATTIGIITDFTIHPYWEDTVLDYYVTAGEQLNNLVSKKGIPLSKILPFGIPIQSKFANYISKQDARTILGIEDKTTVLVISGSMGYGNMLKIINQLDRLNMDFQMISVCGNNKRVKQNIDKLVTRKKLYNFGFVDNVDVLMSAADCIATKPGGLTTSEALAKGLPIISLRSIPGQEERNLDFLLNNGAGMGVSPTFPIDECMFQLIANHQRLPQIAQAAKLLGKPNATADLGDFIVKLKEKKPN